MKGQDIIIYTSSDNGTSWTAVAKTRSDELQAECEMMNKASATQQEWNEVVPGRKSWQINSNWLVSAVADVRKVLQVGTRVKIRMGGKTYSSAAGVEGYAYVRTCVVNTSFGNLATGSFTFVGDGALA